MSGALIIVFLFSIFIGCFFLAKKMINYWTFSNGFNFLKKRVKNLLAGYYFVGLKLVNRVLDTLIDWVYQIDNNGNNEIATEYRACRCKR